MDVFIDSDFYPYFQSSPIQLVDVGARGGLQSNWKDAESFVKIIGFEPDPKEFANLTQQVNDRTLFLNTALYKQETTCDFYLTQDRAVSSFLKPNLAFLKRFPNASRFEIEQVVQLDTDTLDNQLKKNKIADVDFIKLDTQGSEYYVLEGAQHTLRSVLGLEMEVEFVEMYHGQPLFSDVDQLLRKYNFHLLDIKPVCWKRQDGRTFGNSKGQLIFADVLYLRSPEQVCQIVDQISDPELRKTKVLKAISLSILYGYLDYALEILNEVGKVFDEKEKILIHRNLEAQVPQSKRLPKFPGRGRLTRVVTAMYKALRQPHPWSESSDQVLGNLK